MKGIIYFLGAALILLFASCSDNGTNVNQPASPQKQLFKIPANSERHVQESENQDGQDNSDNPKGLFTTKKEINGNVGGSMFLAKSYLSVNGKMVAVLARINFPAGAFKGSQEITMTTDDQYAAIYFYPHMVFNKPLSLTLAFTGLDLSQLDLNEGNVGFYFIDDEGNMTPIANKGITVNPGTGTLMVLGARIEHFSRYAFAK